ncbi:hypothetical protein AS156_31535 [Bradyrhizobium macuxiense]|uniref:Uncharacterized protein n=1 Tax=Bradyrhizobium macuxiense TaxID=1755647 RepID=A0A120FQX5_9BRAD|nr:hypothetical protein [Bradyrhizobium macuxiense]KWV59212.1 hypothetical protein AS156_31535 [Bradyrhizobium macuxiense]
MIAVFSGRHALMGMAAIAATLVSPVVAQDRMTLGPRQFEVDKSGAGAVLCAWSLYLSIQAKTAACALPRRPTDEAIDQAIVAIDQFILENSSLHPTKEALEAFKRNAATFSLRALNSQPQLCQGSDLDHFRSIDPEKIRAGVKALLAVPREPVMNPCL